MQRWALVCLLAVGVIIAYVDRTNLSIALASQDFRSHFDLSDYQRGLLNSAFFWSYTLMQIPSGLIVDRFGVRIPLAIAFGFWCIVAASTSMATQIWHLVAFRLALGVGESIVFPAGLAWMRNNMAEHERGLAAGIFVSGSKWGPAVAALLASWLITNYGWQQMFLVLGAGGAIWLVPWLLFSKDNVNPSETKQNVVEVPISYLMKTPQMWGILIGTFCYNYFLFYSLTWLPAYFVERRHLSLSSMGVYSFFSFAGSAIVAVLAGAAADRLIRRGRDAVDVRRWFSVAGLVLASTEVIGAMSDSNQVAIFFAAFSLAGLGLATANYWALTQTLIPGTGGGRIAAIQNTSLNLAGVIAPIVTGWLKQVTGSYVAPMQAIWVVLIIGIIAFTVLIRKRVVWPASAPA